MNKLKFIISILILLCISVACTKQKQNPTEKEKTTKNQYEDIDTSNAKTVTMDGYDPNADVIVEKINIWGNYEKRSYVGSVLHGEKVKMLKREGDGVLIKTSDGTIGWVTYWFIKELK